MKLNLKNIRVAVEITSFCNLSCQMCPYPFMKRKKNHMPFENLLKIKEIVRKNGLKVRWLHEMGEPLLYPNLKEAIEMFPEAILSTNGMLLEGYLAKVIAESKIERVRICIDTLNPKAYEKLRKGGDFERVIRNALDFLDLTKDKKIIVEIQKMVSKITKDESVKAFELFFKKAKYKNLKIIQKTCEGLDTTEETELHKKYSGCFQGGPYNWLVFLANGDITHCCYDYEGIQRIGTLEDDFENVLRSPKLKEIEKAFLEKDFENLPACKNCFRFKEEVFTPPPYFYKILRKIPLRNFLRKWFI